MRTSVIRLSRGNDGQSQVSLVGADQSCESVCSGVSLQQKMLGAVHCDMEQVRRSIIGLDAQIQAVLLENLSLRNCIEEQQEKSRSQLLQFGSYRSETQEYRTAVSALESRADVHQELRQKEQEVRDLRAALEELKTDLQNPDGSAVRQAQKDLDFLKANIHEARQTVREKKAQLENEERTQTQLRREIEIQQRRCEAVLKRLRSQLKKAQSGHWQLRSDVTHLEKQLQDLRSQLEEDQR
ncbi:Coiled-coil domain-containing protein 122 [Anabarilius grahami]|uniref:Coiled-coil domain-containing protein 122 n=1 Tax=Anabarilius grahami TaxID=495550 RepID=A0A3N0XZY6_ANAGA|nr:Coiled-coil domain-containing protein 122 [Anabarilius grahami]